MVPLGARRRRARTPTAATRAWTSSGSAHQAPGRTSPIPGPRATPSIDPSSPAPRSCSRQVRSGAAHAATPRRSMSTDTRRPQDAAPHPDPTRTTRRPRATDHLDRHSRALAQQRRGDHWTPCQVLPGDIAIWNPRPAVGPRAKSTDTADRRRSRRLERQTAVRARPRRAPPRLRPLSDRRARAEARELISPSRRSPSHTRTSYFSYFVRASCQSPLANGHRRTAEVCRSLRPGPKEQTRCSGAQNLRNCSSMWFGTTTAGLLTRPRRRSSLAPITIAAVFPAPTW